MGKTNQEKNKLNNKFKTLTEKYNQLWKDTNRVKVYYLVAKGKIDEAIVILKSTNLKRKGHGEWFKEHIENMEYMKKFESSVTSSGSKYIDIKIEEGKIKNIIGGNVKLITDFEEKEVPLMSLSLNSLMPIAKQVFPDMQDSDLREFLVIMTGSIAKINDVAPKNKELKNILEAVCEYKTDRIRALSFIDEKKAREAAVDFKKEFEEIPDWNETYKPELQKLFQKEKNRDME